jgi:RND family efflux transporter MFP subunit
MKYITKAVSISFLALAMGLSGCGKDAEPTAVETNQKTIKADVVKVGVGTVPLKSVVPGSVVPDQKAQIASRIMGYIENLDVKVGDKVTRGDLLFSIDSGDINSKIQQARSGFEQAKAALEYAAADYKRFAKLYKDNAVSKQQFDKVRLQFNVAQENLSAARAGLRQARDQLNYANVKAPFDGVIVQKMATAGSLAAPGNPVVVMENLSSLSVQTQVSNELYAALRIGDPAVVKIDGINRPVEGTIYTLVSAADPKTRTHTVKLNLPDVDFVNSGTFARVSFTRGERPTLMLPSSAIVERAGINGVFVVLNGRAFFHMVRTGAVIGDMVEVQAGLVVGDQVVVSNNETLMNGDLIDNPNVAVEAEGA